MSVAHSLAHGPGSWAHQFPIRIAHISHPYTTSDDCAVYTHTHTHTPSWFMRIQSSPPRKPRASLSCAPSRARRRRGGWLRFSPWSALPSERRRAAGRGRGACARYERGRHPRSTALGSSLAMFRIKKNARLPQKFRSRCAHPGTCNQLLEIVELPNPAHRNLIVAPLTSPKF